MLNKFECIFVQSNGGGGGIRGRPLISRYLFGSISFNHFSSISSIFSIWSFASKIFVLYDSCACSITEQVFCKVLKRLSSYNDNRAPGS